MHIFVVPGNLSRLLEVASKHFTEILGLFAVVLSNLLDILLRFVKWFLYLLMELLEFELRFDDELLKDFFVKEIYESLCFYTLSFVEFIT